MENVSNPIKHQRCWNWTTKTKLIACWNNLVDGKMGSVFLVLLVFFLLCDADRIQWDNDMRVYKWVFDGGAKLEGIFKSEDKERVVSRG
mmetsp:Transcript_6134/g.14897  ORF Transcript_6134/g.14897 Transcript_6134/m.14897 type:complete len:89 (+) Transcript_6134:274-540(+)